MTLELPHARLSLSTEPQVIRWAPTPAPPTRRTDPELSRKPTSARAALGAHAARSGGHLHQLPARAHRSAPRAPTSAQSRRHRSNTRSGGHLHPAPQARVLRPSPRPMLVIYRRRRSAPVAATLPIRWAHYASAAAARRCTSPTLAPPGSFVDTIGASRGNTRSGGHIHERRRLECSDPRPSGLYVGTLKPVRRLSAVEHHQRSRPTAPVQAPPGSASSTPSVPVAWQHSNPVGHIHDGAAGSERSDPRTCLNGPTSTPQVASARQHSIRWALLLPTPRARVHRSRHLRAPTSAQLAPVRRRSIRWAPTPTPPAPSAPIQAPPGSYVGTVGSSAATLDPVGTYTNAAGSSAPITIPVGYYDPSPSKASHQSAAPVGTYIPVTGATPSPACRGSKRRPELMSVSSAHLRQRSTRLAPTRPRPDRALPF